MSTRSLPVWILAGTAVLGVGCTPPSPVSSPKPPAPSPSAPKPSEPTARVCSTAEHPGSTHLIARVELVGLRRVAPTDVCQNLGTVAGQRLDPQRVHVDADNLWKSGLFDDVSVSSLAGAAGPTLTFTLRERPLVHRATIHGVDGARLERAAAMFPQAGQLFDHQSLRDGVEKLREDYRDDAFLRPDIQFKIHEAPNREVDLDVKVVPGPRTLVQSITLRGVAPEREAEVRALIDTQNGTVNTKGMPYRADVLERDRYRIEALYKDRGMLRAGVAEEELALSVDGTTATLTLAVSEGETFKLRSARCVGDLAGTEKKCLELLAAKKGAVFNRNEIQRGIERIKAFQQSSHRGDEVLPELSLDDTTRSVDLTIKISSPTPP